MNITTKLAALALAFIVVATSLHAQQLNITTNADGSDGALIVTVSTNIDLSQAGIGIGDSWTNASIKPGYGTYDPVQWAVVFKYTSVNIAAGATVTFSNNVTHAPVVWLVSGNVTINGELSLDGQSGSSDLVNLPEPGPGGFRGGGGVTYGNGPGFGPGGSSGHVGFYSGYYGNQQIIPLIGGSGGDGNNNNGGGGGGAILIAASGTIAVNNSIHANGGSSPYNSGSGGGIRLVANQILGAGTVQALGGTYFGNGGVGIIRLESAQPASTQLSLNPSTIAVLPDSPPKIFPATNTPTATIYSVAGQTPPVDPQAAMSSAGNDDLRLVTTNAVAIQVRTTNFPTNGTVYVYIKPRNAAQTVLSNSVPISGDSNAAIWQVSTVLNYSINQGHTVIQARAVY